MKKPIATATGFLVAPLVSSVLSVFLLPIINGSDLVVQLGLLPLAYFFSSFAMVLLGMPAFLILDRLNLITWWSTLGAGLVIGGVMCVAIRLPSPPYWPDFLTMVPVGAVSAFSFWLVWQLAD